MLFVWFAPRIWYGTVKVMNSLSILVVDDNETAAKALQKLLNLRGHTVTTAFSGEEALILIPDTEPQVVLMDIGLPDMTGYEVAQKLRQEKQYEGTLVALTGYGQDTDKETAQSAGFNHHLTKPAGLAEIEAILENV
jgi:CheY-like chemotaxis protein